MIKKLLLILAFGLPLFAQVQNTQLQWISKGNYDNNANTQWSNFLFEYEDTLWLLSEDGSRDLFKWENNAWLKIIENTNFNIPYYTEGAIQKNGGFDYIQVDSLIYAVMNYWGFVQSPGVNSYASNTQIYNIKTRTTSQSANGWPGLSSILRNSFSFTQDINEDSIIIYGVSPSYSGDTTWNRLSKPLNTATQDWSTINISGVVTRRDLDVDGYSRGHVYSFEMGGYIYLLSGTLANINNVPGKPVDTLWIHKSTDRVGTTFNEINIYGFPNDQYYTITGHTIIDDSTALLFFDGSGSNERGLHIFHADGSIETLSIPTSLRQYGYIMTTAGYLLVSVNDQSVGDGADSSKLYIRDPDLNWSWMMGPTIINGDYGCPNWFQEIDGIVYAMDSKLPWLGPTQSIDAQARLEDRIFMLDGFLSITTPLNNASFTGTDINLTYAGGMDSVLFYYSEDLGSTWSFVDTIYNGSYTWLGNNILSAGINGTTQLYLTSLDSGYTSNIREIFYLGAQEINILYPLSLSSSKSVGDTIHIEIETTLVDTFSLFYATGDSTNWIPLALNLTSVGTKDTVTYVWTIPNIYGAIYLLATENTVSDTADNTIRTPAHIGSNHPSQPWICWGSLGGDIIETRRYYDQSCGWASYATWVKSTMTLNDYADGYTEMLESCPAPGQYACVTTNPLRSPGIWYFNNPVYEYIPLEDFYTTDDTIIYKSRRYYIGADSVFYCDDLVNGKDSLVISDLGYLYDDPWMGTPSLTLYNIQRSKIQNDTLLALVNLEVRNDQYFIPTMLIHAQINRGEYVVGIELLDEPADVNAVSDMVLLFSELNIRRDYFRGIDPKARKSGR